MADMSAKARLGFGCGSIVGGAEAARSRRIIEAALDEGVDYIDTARLYGEGTAEGVLKPLMPSIRSRITLATKVGILPTSQAMHRKLLGRIRRSLMGRLPSLATRLPASWEGHPRFGRFSYRSMERSLDRSLQELGTDYVDILLLHECRADHASSAAVARFIERATSSGRIRSWGIAATAPDTRAIVATGQVPPVVQLASSVFEPLVSELPAKPALLTVTHGGLKSLSPLLRVFATSPELASAWSLETGSDPANGGSVAALLLAEALAANRGGVVLFSSSNPANIAASARVAREQPLNPIVLAGIRRFAGRADVRAALAREQSGTG